MSIKYWNIFFPTSYKPKIEAWRLDIFRYLKIIQNYHLLNCETMKLLILFTHSQKKIFLASSFIKKKNSMQSMNDSNDCVP